MLHLPQNFLTFADIFIWLMQMYFRDRFYFFLIMHISNVTWMERVGVATPGIVEKPLL